MPLPNVKRQCKDCPFRKDSLRGWLGNKRMAEILNAKSFVCHKKIDLQCAGHMLIKGLDNDFVMLASRLQIETGVKGRELVFDTVEECIDHHSCS